MKIKRILTFILITVSLLSGCGNQSDDVPVLLPSIAGQTDLAIVEKRDLYDITYYDAMLSPVTTDVSVETSVTLSEILVSLGDTVKKGDVLAYFNDEYNSATLNETAETNTEYELLQLDIQILETYIAGCKTPSNEAEKNDLELKKLELEELKLQLKYSGFEEIKSQTEKTTGNTTENATNDTTAATTDGMVKNSDRKNITEVTAPCDGVIVYRTTAISQEKIPAYSLLFTIAQDTTVIKSDYIAEEILQSADCIYAVYNNLERSVFDTEERLFTRLYDSDGSISTIFNPEWCNTALAGTYLPIYVISNMHENVLCVPTDCIRADDIGYFVYVSSDDTRERRSVEIGLITAAYVEIISGVQEGENIIVSE